MNPKRILKKAAVKIGLIKEDTFVKYKAYLRAYQKNAFSDTKCSNYEQYEAVITRWYHTIEKGLSYSAYRAGFGKDNIEKLISLMEQYQREYDTDADFYRTALSCLQEYVKKNKEHGVINYELTERINSLSGNSNERGGVIRVEKPDINKIKQFNYAEIMKNRHSIREFSEEPVDLELLKNAILLAQYTPSACNRQGWKTRIVADRDKVLEVLQYQTGSRGFREQIDKLLLVTCDIRYFNQKREIFQPFIDGGMYAESLINALFYEGIGSVPLSASLTSKNEKSVRNLLGLKPSEVLILFIGVGNYPDSCLTPRSERKQEIDIEVIE